VFPLGSFDALEGVPVINVHLWLDRKLEDLAGLSLSLSLSPCLFSLSRSLLFSLALARSLSLSLAPCLSGLA